MFESYFQPTLGPTLALKPKRSQVDRGQLRCDNTWIVDDIVPSQQCPQRCIDVLGHHGRREANPP